MKPAELQLGNFISVFGKAELVIGLTPNGKAQWFVNHTTTYQQENPIPQGVLFDPEPIELTYQWLCALRLEEFEFPPHIKYVHEAQNYAKWVYQVSFDRTDWALIHELNMQPKHD